MHFYHNVISIKRFPLSYLDNIFGVVLEVALRRNGLTCSGSKPHTQGNVINGGKLKRHTGGGPQAVVCTGLKFTV